VSVTHSIDRTEPALTLRSIVVISSTKRRAFSQIDRRKPTFVLNFTRPESSMTIIDEIHGLFLPYC
jgi:hypothetical protein